MEYCFVNVDPLVVGVLTFVLTAIAVYLTLKSFHGEKQGLIFSVAFVLISCLSLVFVFCWAFVVALLECGMAVMMWKNKVKVIYMD
ncbi:MAG: hypothetical protein ABIG95_00545 [Candidatus Woesearchaeota archaeon]